MRKKKKKTSRPPLLASPRLVFTCASAASVVGLLSMSNRRLYPVRLPRQPGTCAMSSRRLFVRFSCPLCSAKKTFTDVASGDEPALVEAWLAHHHWSRARWHADKGLHPSTPTLAHLRETMATRDHWFEFSPAEAASAFSCAAPELAPAAEEATAALSPRLIIPPRRVKVVGTCCWELNGSYGYAFVFNTSADQYQVELDTGTKVSLLSKHLRDVPPAGPEGPSSSDEEPPDLPVVPTCSQCKEELPWPFKRCGLCYELVHRACWDAHVLACVAVVEASLSASSSGRCASLPRAKRPPPPPPVRRQDERFSPKAAPAMGGGGDRRQIYAGG